MKFNATQLHTRIVVFFLVLWAMATLGMAAAHAATAQRVAAGDNHSLAIRSDGTLWAWGDNSAGQLGNGTITLSTRPVKVGDGFTQVSAAGNQSMAIKADGTLWAWGENGMGQLGTGTTQSIAVPVAIGTGFVQVSTSTTHTLAVKADGSLWAWGSNAWGQLGVSPDSAGTNLVLLPVKVGVGFAQVSAGAGPSLAVKLDGTLWAWGRNDFGQVGNGAHNGAREPTPTQIGTGYASVSAGKLYSSAVKTDGTFWRWGNASLAPYTGSSFNLLQPLQLRTGVAQAFAGDCYYLLLHPDGDLIAKNECNSRVFAGGYVSETKVGSDFDQAATGAGHAVGLKRDGSVWVWGDNSAGQLGNGRISVAAPLEIAGPVLIGDDFSRVATGDNHALGIKRDGTLVAWGFGELGQLGSGTTLQSNSRVSLGNGFSEIAAGGNSSFAVKTDGSLWSWGSNRSGQLGTGTFAQASHYLSRWTATPAQVGSGVSQVAAGSSHAAALQADGTLWAWGANDNGQLGNGSTVEADSPQRIGTGFRQVAIKSAKPGYGEDTFALDSNGTLWAWGSQFTSGYPRPSTLATPPQKYDTRGFASVNVSDGRVDATKTDGSVWIPFDLTGTSYAAQKKPVRIDSGFVYQFDSRILSSENFSLALKADGTLWGWGDNRRGQLGAGLPATVPSPMLLGSGFKKLTGGIGYALALKTDGSLLGWGSNVVLQLGRTPVRAEQVSFTGQPSGNTIQGQITATGLASNLTLRATLTPDPSHTRGTMFFVAILPDGQVFTHTLSGWLPLDAGNRQGHGSGLRPTQVNLLVDANTVDLRGTVIYMGYGLGTTASESWDEMLASQRFKVGATLQ